MSTNTYNEFNEQGIIDLEDEGLIAVEGHQAEIFLQGLVTCDVREITDQQSRLSALCNHQGRVIASFYIFKNQSLYYLQLPLEIVPLVMDHLKKYAVFSKTLIKNVSDQWQTLGILGVQTIPGDCIQIPISNNPSRVKVIGTPEKIGLVKQQLQEQFTIKIIDRSYWKYFDILSKIPIIFNKTSGEFTPHMIDLHLKEGVSFNKGCYLGQEIIARTHYLGQSKRQLCVVSLEGEFHPNPGDPLKNGNNQTVGAIVDMSSKDFKTFLLVVVQVNALQDPFYWNNQTCHH